MNVTRARPRGLSTPRRKTRTAEAGSVSRVANPDGSELSRRLPRPRQLAWERARARGRRAPSTARRPPSPSAASPMTRFRVASITKPFTATLALKLLDLDADRPASGRTTCGSATCSPTRAATTASSATWPASATATMRSPPRAPSCRPFGGSSAVERGLVVCEHAATGSPACCALELPGSTYEEALAEHVLRPAGLEATAFDAPELSGTGPSSGDERLPPCAPPVGRPRLERRRPARVRALAARRAEPRPALRVPLGKPVAGVYGLGLFGERVGGVDVWGHGGSYGGFQSTLLLVPDRGAAFVGLTNSGRGAQALRELEDAWFERVIGARRRAPEPVELDRSDPRDASPGTYANSTTTATVAPVPAAWRSTSSKRRSESSCSPGRSAQKTFEISAATRTATGSTSRWTGSCGSAAGSPSASSSG